jgi:hypothetical protein
MWGLMVAQHEQEEIRKLIKPCREGKEYFVRLRVLILSIFSVHWFSHVRLGRCSSRSFDLRNAKAWVRSARRSTLSA